MVTKAPRSNGTGIKRRKGLPHPLIQQTLLRWRETEFLRTKAGMEVFGAGIVMDDKTVERVASFAPIAS